MIRRYMRPAELAEEFGVSIDKVYSVKRIISRNIKQGGTRYGALDIIGDGKTLSVRTAAYIDAVKYGNFVNTSEEQYCPMYDPDAIEYELHLIERPPEIDIEAVAAAVLNQITNALMKGERT